MSVGGWLTENHQRPVAARETAQQSSAEALQQDRTQLLARSQPQQNRAGGQRIGLGHLSARFRASAATDLRHTHSVNRGDGAATTGEGVDESSLHSLGREVDSPVLSTEWPEPRLHDEGASGRAA